MKPQKWLLLICWLCLTGCQGVLEVRFEQEPTPSALSLGKVAYIVGGDIWVADLDIHQQTRLTRDGRNGYPRWSTDGRWIAYLKGDRLWAVEISTGREWPISEEPVKEFAWSPAESRLTFLSARGLVVWWADRQSIQHLAESDDRAVLGRFAWHPGGQWLAYESGDGEWSLHKVSLDGAPVALYTAPDWLHLPYLAGWSPDGRWLLAWVGSPSATARADGMPLCLIPAEGGQPWCPGQKTLLHPDWLSWSPAGQLALIIGEGRETWVNKGLAVMEPGTLSVRRLITPTEQAPIQPAFSPDGRYIAYSAGPATPMEAAYARRDSALAQRRIWVVDVSSGNKRQLTNDDRFRDERPLWSTDGKHILFVRLDEKGAGLWLMKAEGSDLRQVIPELTPRPDPTGEYGYINWQALWDWWQPPQGRQRIASSPISTIGVARSP